MSDQKEQRIITPCPSCGHRTLFISDSGHLTCSLIGCSSPGVEATWNALQKHLKTMRGIADEWRAAYEDTEHGQKEREWQAEREHTASVVTALTAQVSALRAGLAKLADQYEYMAQHGISDRHPDDACAVSRWTFAEEFVKELRTLLTEEPPS